MKENMNRVICIIGMHRSGTSMVAQLLGLAGLDLGPQETLLGANPSNSEGHFEHTGFLKINEALLDHFGGTWDRPPDLQHGWHLDNALEGFRAEAKSVVQTFCGSALWGWKEPRTTILLPFWKSVVRNLQFVICVRSPLEVAASLAERNSISLLGGARLWSRYTRSAIRDTEGCPRMLTFYEDYFTDPWSEAKRLLGFCGLEAPQHSPGVREAICHELRHHNFGILDLVASDVFLECKLLYLTLRGLSGASSPRAEPAEASGDAAALAIGGVLALLDELHGNDRIERLQTAIAAKEQELNSLRQQTKQQLEQREGRITQLEQDQSRLEQDNIRLRAFADAVRHTWAYRFYRTFLKRFISDRSAPAK